MAKIYRRTERQIQNSSEAISVTSLAFVGRGIESIVAACTHASGLRWWKIARRRDRRVILSVAHETAFINTGSQPAISHMQRFLFREIIRVVSENENTRM